MQSRGTSSTTIKELIIRKKGKLKDYSSKTMLRVMVQKMIRGFSEADLREIGGKIDDLTEELNQKILDLFQEKCDEKLTEVTSVTGNNNDLYQKRFGEFSDEMSAMETRFDYLKNKEIRMCVSMDDMVEKTNRVNMLRGCLNALKRNKDEERSRRHRMRKATEFYNRRMKERLFAYWKNLNLKSRVIRKVDFVYDEILKKIKLDTLKNIEVMKTRIRERELEIKNMRAAKSEFSYHLNQSLLKTINNLNMEVLDLKQNELADDYRVTKAHDGPNVEQIVQNYMQQFDNLKRYEVKMVKKKFITQRVVTEIEKKR